MKPKWREVWNYQLSRAFGYRTGSDWMDRLPTVIVWSVEV